MHRSLHRLPSPPPAQKTPPPPSHAHVPGQHVSCQNKPLGEGTAEGEPSARETPATNPKQTLRAPPGPHRGSVRSLQPGRGSQARGCPFPEPRWWEAAGRAVVARAQLDVHSGPAAATRPPPGPDARDHPDTRRGSSAPAPRSHAGRRFEVKQEDSGQQETGLYRAWPWRPRTEF